MKPSQRSQLLMFIFGGVLPVIAFALVEEYKGVIWGTIAGMIFGLGEVLYEKIYVGRVAGVTWFSNALVLILGVVSLVSEDGLWFKLQPAILLACFGAAVVGSSVLGRPFLLAMSLKQNPKLPISAVLLLTKLNLRVGFLFLALAAVSAHAAFFWPTEAWAFLKSVGVMIIFAVYLAAEVFYAKFMRKPAPSRTAKDENDNRST